MTKTKIQKKRISPYKRASKRLFSRIQKEFDKKFYIGDIVVTDEEYVVLIDHAVALLRSIIRIGHHLLDAPDMVTALVQIGIKHYDGNFWNHAEKEFGIQLSQRTRNLLGDTLISTLKIHNKFILSESERVQTILFHGFVSDYYSKGLFELLFQYYARDLERDIYRNDRQQMQALMDTLSIRASLDEKKSEAFADSFITGTRGYQLKYHTLCAISANPVHSRVRLRRLLRLIDKAFWNDNVPKNPTSRLTIRFKEWLDESPSYKAEYGRYMLGEIKNRGKKHFSSPYLFADIRRTKFEVHIPSQIIHETEPAAAVWEITTCNRVIRIPVEYDNALTGFKSAEVCCPVMPNELFETIKCQLLWNESIIKRFSNLPAASVRFFDLDGDYAPRLFKIPMCAYTKRNAVIDSPALLKSQDIGQLIRWDFIFEAGDIVVLPNGDSMAVGENYLDGLIPRGKAANVRYSDAKHLEAPVYSRVPDLLITVPETKVDGTTLTLNGEKHRISSIPHTCFNASGRRNEKTVLIPIEKISGYRNYDLNSLVVSVPGEVHTQSYDFVLILGFRADFDGAPYIFEERGTVVFPESIPVECSQAERLHGENGFSFDLSTGIDSLMLTIQENLYLEMKIPVFSWSYDNENWHIDPAGELWYSEFNKIKKLYLKSPISKIAFYTDSDIPDDDDEEERIVKPVSISDDVYVVDLHQFKKWLTRDIMKHHINLKFGGREYRFASVYTRSFVANCDINADYDSNILECRCDIIGVSDYFVDIKHEQSGVLIADKESLDNGIFQYTGAFQNGTYSVDVYEAEYDDDNEYVYWPIKSIQKDLINKYDISGQNLEVRQFKPSQLSNMYTNFGHTYWITDIIRVDSYTYHGSLLDNGIDSGLKIEVHFKDLDDHRTFNIAFWDDYEEMYIEFLYDANLRKLVQEEAEGLKASERYRRYRVLYEEDYIFWGCLQDHILESTNV